MTSSQRDQVTVGSTTISYELRRSPHRRTIAVSVHPNGAVSVEAPKGTRRTRIANAVHAKKVWILNQQEHFRRLARATGKRFVSGESFLYLGRQYKLLVLGKSDDDIPVKMCRGHIEVRIPLGLSKDRQVELIRTSLIQWYRKKALSHLDRLTQRHSRNLGVTVEGVRVREMRRRWGSASHTGRITYNWRIILAPKRLVEYVVAHEVCHLKHDDHSSEFWRLLERTMPDYDRRRLELAVNGPKYDLPFGDENAGAAE